MSGESIRDWRIQLLAQLEEMDTQIVGALSFLEGEGGLQERAGEVGVAVLDTTQDEVRQAADGLIETAAVAASAVAALGTFINTFRGYVETL